MKLHPDTIEWFRSAKPRKPRKAGSSVSILNQRGSRGGPPLFSSSIESTSAASLKPLLLVLTSLVAVFSLTACASWRSWCFPEQNPVSRPEIRALDAVRRAYDLLLTTEEFASAHVDVAGTPSCQALAFQELLDSRMADSAFKRLLKEATIEGQLYALSGLYFTDPSAFEVQVERYSQMTELVTTHFGCVLSVQPVAAIVRSKAPLAPSLLQEWHDQNPLEEYPPVDIEGGGWPTEFKYAFK